MGVAPDMGKGSSGIPHVCEDRICFARLLAALLVIACPALVAHAGSFAIEDSIVTGGGGRSVSVGGCLAINTSIGQPALGTMSAGEFDLQGGFWAGAGGLLGDTLFNHGFEECR